MHPIHCAPYTFHYLWTRNSSRRKEIRIEKQNSTLCWFPGHPYSTCLCPSNAPFPLRLDLPDSCLFWVLGLTAGSSSMLLPLLQISTNPREPAQIPPLLGRLSQLWGLHYGWVIPWFTLLFLKAWPCQHLLTCLPAIWSLSPSAWALQLSPLAPRP